MEYSLVITVPPTSFFNGSVTHNILPPSDSFPAKPFIDTPIHYSTKEVGGIDFLLAAVDETTNNIDPISDNKHDGGYMFEDSRDN